MKKNITFIVVPFIIYMMLLTVGFNESEKGPEPKVAAPTVLKSELGSFRSKLFVATTKHLDMLIDSNGNVVSLDGKSTDAMTAFAFYHMYEIIGNQKYRAAALELCDRVLKDMKASKFGVLYVKEKETGTDESISGGGPPALSWYTGYIAYILNKEGGRNDDIKYIAIVLDNFPWNDDGWWAPTIDITTGELKIPLTKPSPINKTSSLAILAHGLHRGHLRISRFLMILKEDSS